jgi:hypothetical protein
MTAVDRYEVSKPSRWFEGKWCGVVDEKDVVIFVLFEDQLRGGVVVSQVQGQRKRRESIRSS